MSKSLALLGGLKSFLPIPIDFTGTGGTTSWEYCLAVWLRHVRMCEQIGVIPNPGVVVEVGPGDSLGTGICAVLAGFKQYIAVDVLDHVQWDVSAEHITALEKVFLDRTPLAANEALDRVLPPLLDRSIPERWAWETSSGADMLGIRRSAVAIRESVANRGSVGVLSFRSPWSRTMVEANSVDWVFSQVALQDMAVTVQEPVLEKALATFHSWLRKGALMTHQIDLSCPGGPSWNHHWAWSKFEWKLIRGKRPYYVNGLPLSRYLELMSDLGFDTQVTHILDKPGLTSTQVAPSHQGLPSQDYSSAAAFVIATKR
jgi:hypothetical protein